MSRLYGYLIDSSVLFLPQQRQLISHGGKTCKLRNTMNGLLCYLLEQADYGIIVDDDILLNVWEKNSLSATYSRQWQVVQDLKVKLFHVGVSNDLIFRVRGKGYRLNSERVTPLYTRAVGLGRLKNSCRHLETSV